MTSDEERDFMLKQFQDADREAARENCTGGIAVAPGESSGCGVIATIGETSEESERVAKARHPPRHVETASVN